MDFLFPGRERVIGTCVVVITLMPIIHVKLRIASPPVSLSTKVVVQKALYRFVGTCERSMRVRVVGVAFLFPVRERANGSCDYFDAYA